jgi:UDP-N-acetylmuramoyl-tripeptide--D-alanyl-D-alanine ligase
VIPLPVAELGGLGRLEARADVVTGVRIDSRLVEPGDLFVAVGRGADFADDARARGAAATLVPNDAFAAMAAIGRAVRGRSGARVVAITGSTGKTSTKDILAALCAPVARTVAAEASFNNELGVPLTVARLDEDTEICIVEIGMRGLGQIAELAAIARPLVGVITSIGPVHLEVMGSEENIAQAKAELIGALPAGGVAVVPADAPGLDAHLGRDDVEIRRFSARDVLRAAPRDDFTEAEFEVAGRRVELSFNFAARHHVVNALAALHAYDALDLPLDRAHEGATQVAFSRWRGDELPLPGDGLLINDAYNANPMSMRAALDHLVARAGSRRRVAVLGDMAELGPEAQHYHREIGDHAAKSGVDVLLAVGPLAAGYIEGQTEIPVVQHVRSIDEAVIALEDVVRPGDCVLVKASRAMGLEAVAEALAGAAA